MTVYVNLVDISLSKFYFFAKSLLLFFIVEVWVRSDCPSLDFFDHVIRLRLSPGYINTVIITVSGCKYEPQRASIRGS